MERPQRMYAVQLKSLKLSKEDAKKRSEPAPYQSEGPRYPYGTCIRLEKEALKKMGLKLRDFKAKDGVRVEAVGYVKSIRTAEGETYDNTELEIQLTKLGVEQQPRSALEAVSRGIKEARED